jgi:type III restriction enzyme
VELHFDANEEHQVRAVESVCALFAGQPRLEPAIELKLGAASAAVPNRLNLTDDALLANLSEIQGENGLTVDNALQFIDGVAQTVDGPSAVRFPNFSVEMETGTGKTYSYVRTALELNRRYGFSKFLVIVPSVAIREGVLKDMTVTQRHFKELFENLPYRFYVYDSSRVTQVRQFALSASVEFMVMTIDSFNKASNVLRSTTDKLLGDTPIHLVQATRPILILDEPQNMESALARAALAELNPLLALRYSATHRNPYSLVYRLTPFEAYRQGLVKRIAVASVLKESDVNKPYVRLDRIEAKKKSISAKVTALALFKNGAVREKSLTVKRGDALSQKTARPEYDGYVVEDIDAATQSLTFSNGVRLTKGEAAGADREAIFKEQIRYTIEEHFRRQRALRADGIKVLSLFFIDRVANYASGTGIVRTLFRDAFDALKAKDADWEATDSDSVQAAYFAAKRRRGGESEAIDTNGESEADKDAYDLIMRDKERLLSFDDSHAFVFSHSALREGWDNPNVFQICTLNQTVSEVKKRQEVGRGMRLCRNQEGDRVRDPQKNVLTVVVNESYEKYVEGLQGEIAAEYGAAGVPPKPANARKRALAKLRKQRTLSEDFRELWNRISRRTRYSVRIDTEALLKSVTSDIDAITVNAPRIGVTRADVELEQGVDEFGYRVTGSRTAMTLDAGFALPNLLGTLTNLLERTTPPVRLTRRTLLEVYRRSANKTAAMKNPEEFALHAARSIKDRLLDQLVSGIQYQHFGESYEMTLFEPEIESWEQYLVPSKRGVYDHIMVDSEIERRFVEELEHHESVTVYCKLPSWFMVDTPLGGYNPDWAIVWQPRDADGKPTQKAQLYLVRETKDENWKTALRPNELRKIRCGEAHFRTALNVDFAVVSSVSELVKAFAQA